MTFQFKTLLCKDCRREFRFSVEEQRYFLAKGYFEPKRCHACRQARRYAQADVVGRAR